VHTKLAAAVPEVLGIEIAGVDPHSVGINSGQEAFVVIDELLWAGVCQTHGG